MALHGEVSKVWDGRGKGRGKVIPCVGEVGGEVDGYGAAVERGGFVCC